MGTEKRGNYTGRDYSTQAGCNALVETIKEYWTRRGKSPKVWAEKTTDGAWIVQSDMVNGMPR